MPTALLSQYTEPFLFPLREFVVLYLTKQYKTTLTLSIPIAGIPVYDRIP